MKEMNLLFVASGMLFLTACGNAEPAKAQIPAVATVAPEISPAEETSVRTDQVSDTLKTDTTKTKAGKAIDTAKKEIKAAAETVKTETNKAADKVAKKAKEASDTIKKETNKAATKVKKAAKDVKENLKN